MKLRIAFLLLLPHLSSAAPWPEPSSQASAYCRDLTQKMRPLFDEALLQDYRPLTCSDNIKRFSLRLEAAGFDLSRAQALHIHHQWMPHIPVEPLVPKVRYKDLVFGPQRWAFHAVLLVDGLVFDFDFTENLRVVGLHQYLQEMWDTPELVRHYRFQVKPVQLYSGKDLHGEMVPELYRNQTFIEFIMTTAKEPCTYYREPLPQEIL